VAEAEEEGGVKELAVKTKHKTKQHIMSLFRHGGKKAAGVAGDVSVDGRGKRVSYLYPDYSEKKEADCRSVPRLTSCCSVVVCQMMGILDVRFPFLQEAELTISFPRSIGQDFWTYHPRRKEP
jgi:hypothetical protein